MDFYAVILVLRISITDEEKIIKSRFIKKLGSNTKKAVMIKNVIIFILQSKQYKIYFYSVQVFWVSSYLRLISRVKQKCLCLNVLKVHWFCQHQWFYIYIKILLVTFINFSFHFRQTAMVKYIYVLTEYTISQSQERSLRYIFKKSNIENVTRSRIK